MILTGLAMSLFLALPPGEARPDSLLPVQQAAEVASLTEAQRALLEENPLLGEFFAEHPEAAIEALDELLEDRFHPEIMGDPYWGLPEDEVEALQGNPALDSYFRDAPEPALVLLRLMRESLN